MHNLAQPIVKNGDNNVAGRQLGDFWAMPPSRREAVLLEAIAGTHLWHFARNTAYRQTVSARGIGPSIGKADLPRLLRPTAQAFKSYIDILGTPFAQDRPHAFLDWLADQLSIELPRDRLSQFRSRYRSMEALLADIERIFGDLHFELATSSGTSGRSTIIVRDEVGIDKTMESFYLSFQRYLGMQADHRAIFIMPRRTRIAMARMAAFSVERVGLAPERIHFTIPFAAYPDQVRVRTGRTFQTGWRGIVERRVWHPFMNWMNDHRVMPQAIGRAIALLQQAAADGEKVLLFGSWMHLHAIAVQLKESGEKVHLAPGSIFGTGGGLKERYAFTPTQIAHDLAQVVALSDGQPLPLHDVYGMAEGNWAAMQCQCGNYHIPPWIYAVTLDDDDSFQDTTPDNMGLLAFFDPFGGGNLFPAFFKTADQVRLINGAGVFDPSLLCPCGEVGAHITQHSIQRVDLIDEAGCAAQV